MASEGAGISVILAIHSMENFPSHGKVGKNSIIFSIIGADQFPDVLIEAAVPIVQDYKFGRCSFDLR